ncbi:MAG TPA: type II toxin-antitoxin system HicB family antitoxin [Bryobacteraceae bacterium]|nr:type II toxin-antitoxin system HicB family antitoxin [Bryobacteraceae bacterium]
MSGMEYRGYIGSVYYSDEDEVFHGKLEGIRDLVTYEGTDVASLKRSFHEAVDDYLATCKKRNKEPQVPFKGTFNVRVGPELHKRAAVYAAEHGKKLNAVVGEALREYLETVGS